MLGFRKGRHRRPPSEPLPSFQLKATRKAALAAHVANVRLAQASERQMEVSDQARTLRKLREENNFGEMIRRALG